MHADMQKYEKQVTILSSNSSHINKRLARQPLGGNQLVSVRLRETA